MLKRNWFIAEIGKDGVMLFSCKARDEVIEEVDALMSQSENLYPLEWIR